MQTALNNVKALNEQEQFEKKLQAEGAEIHKQLLRIQSEFE